MVIQINFPNGGWLDEDHIIPEYPDENSCCTVYDEDGKTYEITILNEGHVTSKSYDVYGDDGYYEDEYEDDSEDEYKDESEDE